MNVVISACVGALAATAVLVGGVNVAQDDQRPVADTELTTYSSN